MLIFLASGFLKDKPMNPLTLETTLDPQVKVIEEAISKEHSNQCHRCLQDITYRVITDHSSEGDGMSAEIEIGHSEDCSLIEN